MKYGTIEDQERAAMRSGAEYINLYYDTGEGQPALIGRFHNLREVFYACFSYVVNECFGVFTHGFIVRFYRVYDSKSAKHFGWNAAYKYDEINV